MRLPSEKKVQFIDDYVNFIIDLTKADQFDLGKFKLIVDASEGPISLVLENLFHKLSVNVFPVHFETEHLLKTPKDQDYLHTVRSQLVTLGADMGAVFDQTGTQLMVLDNLGQVVPADVVLGMLFEISGRPKTIYDPATGEPIKHLIGDHGASAPTATKIPEVMRLEQANLGGDMEGRYYYKSMNYENAPILALLEIIIGLAHSLEPLSKIVDRAID
jgi:phosphomannomutase